MNIQIISPIRKSFPTLPIKKTIANQLNQASIMKFEKKLITPSIAKEILEANIRNRRPKTPVVKRYAADMAAGKWKEDTAEFVKISKTGVVLDGQQRLMAVIASNTPVYLHVATGLDDAVFDVLDTGSSRTANDTFFVKGVKNANIIPSIISFFSLLSAGYTQKDSNKDKRLTNATLLEVYLSNEKYWQMVAHNTINWYGQFAKIVPPSVIGGMYAYFSTIDGEDATEFMEQFATGSNITNNTVALLRQKLIQDKTSPRKMQTSHRNALIIKTWNFYRKGTEPKILKFDTVNEEFPTAI